MLRFFILIIICLIAASCASLPPVGYETKRGTQKPYKIDGKWYTPVSTSYEFEESGIASWYGRDFHGKLTSNGETYNMHAMTAAHKTLPMGTYVKVKRLDNGKETILRINDRGPFVSGRIIDLSYKAALNLGMENEGTARVKIVALGNKVGDKLVKQDYNKGNFNIQAGAFTVKDNAYDLKGRLERKYGAVAITPFDKNGKTFFRVRIINILSLKEAEDIRRNLTRQGLPSSFIVAD